MHEAEVVAASRFVVLLTPEGIVPAQIPAPTVDQLMALGIVALGGDSVAGFTTVGKDVVRQTHGLSSSVEHLRIHRDFRGTGLRRRPASVPTTKKEWYERIICRGSLADQPRPRAAVSNDLLNSLKAHMVLLLIVLVGNGRGSSRSFSGFEEAGAGAHVRRRHRQLLG